MRTLHIYGQGSFHDDVWIVGDHDALVELMATIQRARNMGEGVCEASVNDGEGFRVHVVECLPAVIPELCLPYFDPMATEREDDHRTHKWPWELLGVKHE